MKKLFATLLALAMLVTTVPAFAVSAELPGTSQATALQVSSNSSGSFTWTEYDYNTKNLWLAFSLSKAGVLTFTGTRLFETDGDLCNITFYVYKTGDTVNPVWEDSTWNHETEKGDYKFNIPLAAGTYYIRLDTSLYNAVSRQLNYSLKFNASSGYEVEPNNDNNTATKISLNKKITAYTGNSKDCYAITVKKDTPIRLRIGNYDDLAKANVMVGVLFPDGKSDYAYETKMIKGDGYYAYDLVLKKGTNIIEVSRKATEMKYYLLASTSITYKAPAIKKIVKEGSNVSVYWGISTYVDGYEVYRKVGSGSWKLLKDFDWNKYEGVKMLDISSKKTYQVRVRSYKKLNGKKYYSDWSKIAGIYKTPSSVKLSTTTYTYNGKTKTPSVTVKDSAGLTLKKNKDYTVSYAKGRKSVGTYKVTVTFKGVYAGKVTKTFTIAPKGTSVSKVSSASKSLKVSWKKQTSQTSGYQIQASTSKSFKSGNTTLTVTKNKTTSATVKSLKAKKTYYVRIRTYKTVSGKKIYSDWSKVKTQKTK